MSTRHPCEDPAPSTESDAAAAPRRRVITKRVDEVTTMEDLFLHCLPAFGGAYLRRIYSILDTAIGAGFPLTVAIAGPVTVSGQHQTWLIPLLEQGWIAYLSTTDAVCYHDGHRALDGHKDPVVEVPIFGDDGALRDEKIIRVTDMAFDEDVLFDQDRFISACLARPEFQKKMAGTEMRHLLGAIYAAQEAQNGIQAGLLATCQRLAIPVLVGAPADGSVFLNSMKLWAMEKAGVGGRYSFELDLHAEVFEACAYHRWGLHENPIHGLATLILGGGVPKNYNLQPEPALGQVLGLPDIQGYSYDVQIVSAPITDGSLSSCPPSEAVTWGKFQLADKRLPPTQQQPQPQTCEAEWLWVLDSQSHMLYFQSTTCMRTSGAQTRSTSPRSSQKTTSIARASKNVCTARHRCRHQASWRCG